MKKNLIFGIHPILDLLERQPHCLKKIYFSEQRHDAKFQNILKEAQSKQIPTQILARNLIDQMVDYENHQGVVAEIQSEQQYHEDDLEVILQQLTKPALLLILDQVQDPHNLGACLRSADAAGVDIVIAPKDRAVGLTPTVRKIASGAAEFVPFIQVTNLARTLKFLRSQNIWLFGTADNADKSLFASDLTEPTALILGSEEKGIRRLTRELCDEILAIPMTGHVSSLNISVAAGICLFEALRQRLSKQMT